MQAKQKGVVVDIALSAAIPPNLLSAREYASLVMPRSLVPLCRLYIEQYSDDESKYGLDAQEALKPIIDLALETSRLKELTGLEKPTVIT